MRKPPWIERPPGVRVLFVLRGVRISASSDGVSVGSTCSLTFIARPTTRPSPLPSALCAGRPASSSSSSTRRTHSGRRHEDSLASARRPVSGPYVVFVQFDNVRLTSGAADRCGRVASVLGMMCCANLLGQGGRTGHGTGTSREQRGMSNAGRICVMRP